ncbi:MAG TPA: fatty acid cis/trans isomerase [Parvularculaceae bacterium]|nr:fatty acid cis/trans isomerase [Parvularculaceae bacterium]
MTSPEGIARGASKEPVYDPARTTDATLTRLGIDASTTEEWRRLGFADIAPHGKEDPESSILWRMLALGRQHPLPANISLPKNIDLDVTRKLSCPVPTEFDKYERENPFGGMPYAMAPLEEGEWKMLSAWVANGAPLDDLISTDDETVLGDQIASWEAFLNDPSPKSRLVARYLYEHLFLAHLYFDDAEDGPFYQLVRSFTPPGQPIEIIATRRPYDDPGADVFFYRLEPITETILHKTHMTYQLGPERLERLKEIFFTEGWSAPSELPSYEPSVASNPFISFADIPAEARYRFLLDDPEYFIRTFIRGPVCSGQVAVNVIEDRFWVMFLDPASDLSITDPSYLKDAAPYLGLPAEHASGPLLERLVPVYLDHHRRYEDFRRKRYDDADPERLGPSIDAIWKGSSVTGAPILTVFRHFDNASVISGFVGDIPETAWVIDYPTLERIYYNLVAGFDVFGSVEHQVGTRLYMDLLRMESEDLFLSFLPPGRRRDLHQSWYRGGHTKIRVLMHQQQIDIDHGVQIDYRTGDAKSELLLRVLKSASGVSPKADPLNRPIDRGGSLSPQSLLLSRLSSKTAPWVEFLPELSLLRVKRKAGPDLAFSFIHDKAHTNVAFLFAESLRLEPEKDTLTILRGQIGSYPNFFFVVDEQMLPRFVNDLSAIHDDGGWLAFVAAYGVRRSSSTFWETADFFQDQMIRQHPLEAGLLDLNRYVDPK